MNLLELLEILEDDKQNASLPHHMVIKYSMMAKKNMLRLFTESLI